MAARLVHRGPDDEGSWADPNVGVGLGHRRLAIQDLSREGHQPMRSADGRYVLIFNGEIYNFLDLKDQLENRGHTFRGHSDTEVILAAFVESGVANAVSSFVGMFAFAVWDRAQRRLWLVRDRAGEKPLYYGWSGGVFVFGSELKALRQHPDWHGEVDRDALALYMRHSYVPAPYSIYRNIFKLPAGSFLSLGEKDLQIRQTPIPQSYWSLRSAVEEGLAHPFKGDERDAMEQLRALLNDSIRQQMVADVPIGAFLSGGIDSSTIVALMQARSGRPIKTFSIGFPESQYDEAPFAKAVANHLGTQHVELYVHASMLRNAVPRMPHIYDEPLADTSHIPTLLLCELARKQVTVCLSGDAGDELFGGYGRYRKTRQLWTVLRSIQVPTRERLAQFLSAGASRCADIESRFGLEPRLFKRLLRLSELLPVESDYSLYQLLVSSCRDPDAWLSEPNHAPDTNRLRQGWKLSPDLLDRMRYWDFIQYLPDEILVKVDRAAMSVNLETRIPLLNHRIIEFAWSLPTNFRHRRGQSKWLLRQLLYQYVPPSLIERPKQGFAAPIEQWLRAELRPWAEDLISNNCLRRHGLFREQTVRRKWMENLSGTRDWGRPLWNVLMFQAWFEHQDNHRTCARTNEREHIRRHAVTQERTETALR
jgi:asparagine synthase (glutamine-hydrolysing)